MATIVGARTWGDFGLDPDDLRRRVAEDGAEDAAGVAARLLRPLRRGGGQAALGGQDARLRASRMRPIAGALAEARFVHLLRDGRDVALSRLARGMGEGKQMAEIAELWRRRIERARRQAKRLRGRYLELRYEDLVADPEPSLRRVCELIELDYDPAMLRYHERAGGRLAELGDLAPAEARRGRPGEERVAAHALATRPADGRAGRRLAGGDERGRSRLVRGGRRYPARGARLRRAILSGPPHGSRLLDQIPALQATAAAIGADGAGAVRGRRRALGDDPAADDARRPPAARDARRRPISSPSSSRPRVGCGSPRS